MMKDAPPPDYTVNWSDPRYHAGVRTLGRQELGASLSSTRTAKKTPASFRVCRTEFERRRKGSRGDFLRSCGVLGKICEKAVAGGIKTSSRPSFMGSVSPKHPASKWPWNTARRSGRASSHRYIRERPARVGAGVILDT